MPFSKAVTGRKALSLTNIHGQTIISQPGERPPEDRLVQLGCKLGVKTKHAFAKHEMRPQPEAPDPLSR